MVQMKMVHELSVFNLWRALIGNSSSLNFWSLKIEAGESNCSEGLFRKRSIEEDRERLTKQEPRGRWK